MKSFTTVLVSVAIVAVNLTLIQCQEEDFRAMKIQVVKECNQQHNISNVSGAVKKILKQKSVSNAQEIKCWLACVMKKFGMIQDGKIDWERCNNITKKYLTNDQDKAKVDMIGEKCKAEVPHYEKDECQLAYSTTLCRNKKWKEVGFPKSIRLP